MVDQPLQIQSTSRKLNLIKPRFVSDIPSMILLILQTDICPDDGRPMTLLLEKESRSKLDKDKVKPYNYTYQNSLYETFKPPSKAYLDQLERAKEVRKTMWRKTFVRTKPNIAKNVGFLPMSKSISKSRLLYNEMTNNFNHFRTICQQTWSNHTSSAFPNPTAKSMEVLIKILLMPLSDKTILDSHCFIHELKREMNDDLEYVNSLEKELDELESELYTRIMLCSRYLKDVNASTKKPKLSIIAAVKVSHFEILCRVHGFVPTVVDAFVFPLSVPWHNDKPLRKDPHPTPADFNVDVCNYLVDNPAPFRKLPEPFLCFVGISRYYNLDENCYPTLWANDDEEVAQGEVPLLQLTKDRVVPLVGVNYQGNVNVQGAGDDDVNEGDCDVVEVNQTEQDEHVVDVGGIDVVADDEVQAIIADKPQRIRKKRKAIDGASSSGLPPKNLREDHGTSGIGANTGRKSVAALQSLLENSTLPVETRHPAVRFVISESSHDLNANAIDDEVTSVIRSSMPPPPVLTEAIATTIIAGATSAPVHESGAGQVQPSIFRDFAFPSMAEEDIADPSQPIGTELLEGNFYVSQDIDPDTLRQVYIPKWNVINDSILDDPDVCRGMIDHLTPPGFFYQLWDMDYEQLLAKFIVRTAR
ncbi:hypothetical protein Tco_0345333 [Tanacetum coccineum]